MEINTNCVRYELPKVQVLYDSESSIAFFLYGLSLNSLPSSYGRNLACVAGGIVRARKVLAEKLRSRSQNGEEMLVAAKPLKLSHACNTGYTKFEVDYRKASRQSRSTCFVEQFSLMDKKNPFF